jgi:hypothetical protein
MRKFKYIKYLLLISVGLFCSCASIKKYGESDLKEIKNVKEIEGIFENSETQNRKLNHQTIKSIIDFRNKIKDTSEIKSVEISVLSESKIQFIFRTHNGKENKYNTEYELNKNGLISLKNKNFRLTGLPYIFGGYRINKTEIGLTKQNQLVLNGVKVDEGAILIILPASFPKINFTYKYDRK